MGTKFIELSKRNRTEISLSILKVRLFFPLSLAICCLLGVLCFFFDDFFLVFFPVCIVFLISLPLVIRTKTDVFSIWSWIFYSSILGVLIRCLYIYFDMPNFNAIDDVFLYGKAKSFLLPAMVLVFVGVFMLVLGYLSTSLNLNLNGKIFKNKKWNEKAFFITSSLLILISVGGLVLFINAQGGLFSMESISSYRGVSDNLAEASPHAYLRLLVSFSGINLFLLTTWLLKYNRMRWIAYLFWLISFLTFVFFNFYISQRAAIVFTLVQLTALSYYLKGFKLPKLKFAVGVILALAIFQLMSTLRNVKDVENEDVKLNITKALEPAILTTNMIDVSKTAHIMDAIPSRMNYEYGATLVTIFIAWIPREFWPDKPVTNVDNTIGIKVFGATTYGSGGVPPGLIAELFWNFWIPGVIIGCYLIGLLIKIINQTILSNIANPNIVIIYVVNFMFIGLSFVGSSFSSVLIGVLQTLIPMILILNIITEKGKCDI
ncbi:oligosaccharide repeat unit polymerase [Pedobacter hiemivivus]|uniref:Oligosaccharide repeat unit polymerase n=1 Tax=Pedobacter hiemivivus TaxID=2530454 RepID=A0A4U1G7S9_9SPHI|nr:O-antigen polymerase [Pedobacter hiemivivus]TKC56952.1 oligosaccharide repeat unit polymerase [Pedobacter hiemivivus]